MVKPHRVVVIDDHPLMRMGITAIVNGDERFMVCGETDDGKKAMDLIRKTRPEVVILDISLKGSNGLEVLKDIGEQFPKVKVLMLSMHEEHLYASRTLRAGAQGYLHKSQAAERLLEALLKIMEGQIYLSEEMMVQAFQKMTGARVATPSGMDGLSDRELEVLHLIGHGFSTRQIAEKLGLNIKTIEGNRTRLKEKLNLTSARALTYYAAQWVGAVTGDAFESFN